MAVHVKYGPQTEAQQELYEASKKYYDEGQTNKAYYDDLFLGTDYEDIYKSIVNKYTSVAPPESFWGFFTGKDAENEYKHNMSLLDELENLATKLYDEEYQSPAKEVQRNAEAGLNSDLLGLSGQSASSLADASVPDVTAANPLENLSNTLNTVMSIYSTIKSFKGINLQNEALDLKNIQEMMKMSRPMIVENMASGFTHGSKGMSDWSDVISLYNPFKGDKRKSKRFAQAFSMELSSGNYAAAEAAYKRLAGLEDGRSAYGTHVGNPNWSPDDSALFHYVGGMAEMSLGSQFSKNKFERNYYNKLSPDAKADFENTSYTSDAFLKRIRNKMHRQLEYDAKNGSILAYLLLMENGASLINTGVNSIGNLANSSLRMFGKKKN